MGASSGPWVLPVSATRRGMKSCAPPLPGLLLEHGGERMQIRARSIQRGRRGREEGGPGRGDDTLLLGAERRQLPAYHGHPGLRIRGEHHVVAHELDECRRVRQAEPLGDLGDRHVTQRLFLPVQELRLLEARRRAAEVLRTEMRGHLRGRQPAVDVGRVPQVKQMIEKSRRQEPALAELAHARAAMPFRQRRAVRADQQADVAVVGSPHAERIEQHQLARRVGEMIVAAQYMRDAHDGIVHGVAKEERGCAVLATNDEVADVRRRKALRPVHEIGELDDRRVGHGETQRGLASLGQPRGALGGGEGAAGAGIARGSACHALELARELELVGRAKARVGASCGLQAGEQLPIPGAAFGLQVRRARTPDLRPLVPLEPEPTQLRDQRREMTRLAALDIRVLDAQYESPAAVSRP